MIEFLKLEKIQFGGIRGQHLSDSVLEMFNNFQGMISSLSDKNYDPLDLNCMVGIRTTNSHDLSLTFL